MKRLCLITSVLIILFSCSPSKMKIQNKYKIYFEDIKAEGAIIIYDMNKDFTTLYNKDMAGEGLLPSSTFKIYNALIGLESGVIPDKDYIIKWDGINYSSPEWNKDNTLETAINNSVTWYYQELARKVGNKKMDMYIKKLEYGNMDISEGIDTFWLEGDLRISAEEQLNLLIKLYKNELPFSKRAQDIVKEIIIIEKTPNYILRGKTGHVMRLPDIYYSLFVGYLEQNNNIYFFAASLKKLKDDFKDFGEALEVTVKILKDMKLL